MIDRKIKLKWRRRYRHSRQQVQGMGQHAEEHLERHFFKRLNQLWDVRRFIIAWLLLVVLLIGGLVLQIRNLSHYYQKSQPTPGGIYTEGILGSFTNANPLYASSTVDVAVSHLVFAGLFKTDSHNRLVGDLADRYDVDNRGIVYTVHLRPNLLWQDGRPLTSADVAFTYQVIQNPDAQSPLHDSWQNITIKALDPQTISFTLPTALGSFIYSLTTGIVPQHVLDGRPMTQLRSVPFNNAHPIGAGPFQWQNIEVVGTTPETREERIGLVPFVQYHDGAPKLSNFIIRAFHDEKRLVKSFQDDELTAMAGINAVPEALKTNKNVVEYDVPLTSAVFVFFKTSQEVLQDVKVRRALVLAANTADVINGLGYPVITVRGPLLSSQVGFDKSLAQPAQNISEASKLLDDAGWHQDNGGIRTKAGKPLTFRLYSQNTSEYTYVTQVLQKQWRAVGVDIQVYLQDSSDMQSVLAFHNYDALLYGVALGIDPDEFAYWHSSQADLRANNRLNFSEYRSNVADKSLEAGRSRSDASLRSVKYKPFLQAWRDDAPGLALYQPRFLYLTHGKIFGFEPTTMNADVDRYANIQNWMIKQTKVYQ